MPILLQTKISIIFSLLNLQIESNPAPPKKRNLYLFFKGFRKDKNNNNWLYLDLDLLFLERLLVLDLLLCFRLDERDRFRLFDGSDSFFRCGDFEGFLFLGADDLVVLGKELRYSDALHCGKAGSLVCSLLVEMGWSTSDSLKVAEAASLKSQKSLVLYNIYFILTFVEVKGTRHK